MMRNRVILFVRAYNDLDCRIPLLLEFKRDRRYADVRVVGIPVNSGINDPRKHEMSGYLEERGIPVASVYELTESGVLLRMLYALFLLADHKYFSRLCTVDVIKKMISAAIILLSRGCRSWADRVLRKFTSSIIFIDEVVFHKGRSFFVDTLVANRAEYGCSIYAFATGQDPYRDLWHNKHVVSCFNADSRTGIPYLVPGKNDKAVTAPKIPYERIEAVGNIRFDLPWIRALSAMSSEALEKDPLLSVRHGKKILFMLSKIEYGVDLDNIVQAINACAEVEGACVIVKPHTRGMTLDMFEGSLNRRIHDGAQYSSNVLTRWADIILFTGSSIVFQAMQTGKRVVFLKYCQQYKTIYDESDAMLIARSPADMMRYVESDGSVDVAPEDVDAFLTEHVYNGRRSGAVCAAVKELIEVMENERLKNV